MGGRFVCWQIGLLAVPEIALHEDQLGVVVFILSPFDVRVNALLNSTSLKRICGFSLNLRVDNRLRPGTLDDINGKFAGVTV